MWARYLRLLDTRPVATKAGTSAALMAAGDALAQTIERYNLLGKAKPEDVPLLPPAASTGGTVAVATTAPVRPYDWLRTGRLAVYGFVFAGPTMHLWYRVLERYVVAGSRMQKVLIKLTLDQTIFAPSVIAAFFVGTGLLEGKSVAQIRARLDQELVPTLLLNWKIWPIANFVNFALVPEPLRVLYVSVIAIAWNTLISMAAARPVAADAKKE